MTGDAAAHEVFTIALREAGDVVTLRRRTQAACRTLNLTGSPLVRMSTVVSEAGEHLLGAAALTARLSLGERAGAAVLSLRFHWQGERQPAASLLAAATRLLDDCRTSRTDDGHQLVLEQRTTAPPQSLPALADELRGALLATDGGTDFIEALRSQNRQLLAALEESQHQQDELQRLNTELEETNAGVLALYSELAGELEETNSGVVALYADLEDKSRQLEQANQYKTRFWANVSHELRSPVNAVIALTRLLLAPEAEPLSAEQRQQVTLVHASGNTLLALVDELLDVAKAEAGRLEPHPVDTDLRALFHQLRGTLQSITQPGVHLRIPDYTQQSTLVTDEVMLTRILRNVLSNALKFTTEGSVTVDVTERGTGPERRFRFRVRDTGVGIPPDEQKRVFEEFYQVPGQHQRGRTGTGLGLPYALRLTEALGGTLSLDSEPGRGTVVVIDIPALTPCLLSPEEEATTTPTGREPAGAPQPDPLGAPARPLAEWSVVVIDDDPAFLAGFRPLIDGLVTSVTCVTDSTTAVDTVRRERPDVVLLDLDMPALDGTEVRSRLAADPATAPIPVVVLTATDPGDVPVARLEPVRAVLDKGRLTSAGLAAALTRTGTRSASPPTTLYATPLPLEEDR
ncbi:ATP-binding protein [Streptomyces parvulus]|uniref:ATP-binding response regulator n=1 Tax=Streptomyces parvulus TaxID=146923 RepID=UPI001E422E49|nr:ATP-binding protein [Streptomyces parvulus]MCC9155448.1 response regulator [Streptomyces parvulus]MCE7687702.1 ATP-binding protein [Streptomyces parvulus]